MIFGLSDFPIAHSRRTQFGLPLTLEVLERREVPAALAIVSITRTASMSLLDQQIRDAVPFTAVAPGMVTGSTRALVGYQVPSQIAPGSMISLGGMGLEIAVSKLPSTLDATLTVSWGDGSPDNHSTSKNPLFIFPHSLLSTGPFTITVTATSDGDIIQAQINVQVEHVLENAQGAYVRGRNQVDDMVQLTPAAGGAVQVDASFLTTPYTTQPGQRPIYIDTLGGNDEVKAAAAVTRSLWIDGGAGNDTLTGAGGDDRMRGAGGNDRLSGKAGADLLFGDSEQDSVYGGAGADGLHGGSDADLVEGGAGRDAIFGDAGADQLRGQEGNDFLLGGLGADTENGGAGNDVLAGGYDNSNFEIDSQALFAAWAQFQAASVTAILTSIVTFPGTDLAPVPNAMTAGGQTLVDPGQFGPTVGNDAAIDILFGGAGRNYLGRSLVSGRPDNDRVDLSAGNNRVVNLTDTPVATTNVQQLSGFFPSSGADLIASPTRTVYAYGRFDTDTGAVIPALGYPLIPEASFFTWYGVQTPGTITNLNVDFTSGGDFWAKYNRPYVALTLAFRGRVIMVSDIFDPMNYTGINGDGSINLEPGRRKEFDYLRGLYETALHPTTNGQIVTFRYDAMRKEFFAVD